MRDDVAIPSPQGWLNVCDGIFHNARRRPLHPAIIERARTVTYADLAALVAKTSGHLESIGFRRGDIVGVALGDDSDHIVALLAVAWLGAIILPMDVRWTAEEKRRIAVHFGAAGIKLTTVPYRGLALALKEIVGGHVDLIFDTAATSLPLHQSKQLQIVAVGGSERSRSLPDVPTIAETGLPGFRAVTWYALVAAGNAGRGRRQDQSGRNRHRQHSCRRQQDPRDAPDGSNRQHPRASKTPLR